MRSARKINPINITEGGSSIERIAAFSEVIYFNPRKNNKIGKAVQTAPSARILLHAEAVCGTAKLPSIKVKIKQTTTQPAQIIKAESEDSILLLLLETI